MDFFWIYLIVFVIGLALGVADYLAKFSASWRQWSILRVFSVFLMLAGIVSMIYIKLVW